MPDLALTVFFMYVEPPPHVASFQILLLSKHALKVKTPSQLRQNSNPRVSKWRAYLIVLGWGYAEDFQISEITDPILENKVKQKT